MNTIVKCLCCGNEFTRTVKQVNQAIKRKGRWACVSCMCGHNRIDREGQRFGLLTVVSRAESFSSGGSSKRSAWTCKCDCGNTSIVSGNSLQSGRKQSCGCDKHLKAQERSRTHGRSCTREYRIWCAMKTRCLNRKAVNYERYGGRGISLCDRWMKSFELFFADMGQCPPGHSIERKNVDGNYEPSNCIWADKVTQSRNTRRTRFITFNGQKKCLAEWAESLLIDQASLRERLQNWPIEKALTTPKGNFA